MYAQVNFIFPRDIVRRELEGSSREVPGTAYVPPLSEHDPARVLEIVNAPGNIDAPACAMHRLGVAPSVPYVSFRRPVLWTNSYWYDMKTLSDSPL